ncbi:MAG: hypothetical protein IT267_04585 [Saprospiraceae bacterium]|nr:hypothetical protein [Saprospiraceae bacterium]
MNKIFILLVLLSFSSVNPPQLEAQSTKKSTSTKSKKKKKDEENPFRLEKFWFGGGINLGFGSYSLSSSVPGNIFTFGIAPIAGYKLTNWLSIGPRAEINYFGGRFDNNPEIIKLNSYTFGGGVFARAKFLTSIFAHIEYSYNSSLSIIDISADNKLITERLWQDQFLVGIGYNPPSIWSYEFYIMYDFLAPKNSAQLPFQYRAGVTWNF